MNKFIIMLLIIFIFNNIIFSQDYSIIDENSFKIFIEKRRDSSIITLLSGIIISIGGGVGLYNSIKKSKSVLINTVFMSVGIDLIIYDCIRLYKYNIILKNRLFNEKIYKNLFINYRIVRNIGIGLSIGGLSFIAIDLLLISLYNFTHVISIRNYNMVIFKTGINLLINGIIFWTSGSINRFIYKKKLLSKIIPNINYDIVEKRININLEYLF